MPYNEHEVNQITYIHEQYQTCGLGKIPPLLEIEEHISSHLLGGERKDISGKNPAKKEHFEATEMKKRLGSGPLRSYAENILIKICAYQKERSERPGGAAGTLDDPIHLTLEEFKSWAIHTLSAFQCQGELQQQIQARMTYLKALEKSDWFPLGRIGSLHFGPTLLEVIELLEAAKIVIKATLESASAEVELKELVGSTKNLLQHTTQYLYFIFRNEASHDFTFANLRHPHEQDKPMQRLLKTQTGQFLLWLIQSTPFLNIFPDEKADALTLPGSEQELIAFPNAQRTDANPFLGSDLLPAPETQKNYGVYALCFPRSDILTAFIEVHALLLELGHFTLVCEGLTELTRWGGDLLIYGLAHQSVTAFLQNYFNVMNTLSTRLQRIQHFARTTYKAQKQAACRDNWLKNYNQAESIYTEIEQDHTQCHYYADHILTKSRQGISEYALKRIQTQIITVLGAVDRCSERMLQLSSNNPSALPETQINSVPPNHTRALPKAAYASVFHQPAERKSLLDRALPMSTQPLFVNQALSMEQKTAASETALPPTHEAGTNDPHNSAVRFFLGANPARESLLEFNRWYYPDVCHYLLQMTPNVAQCIRVMFQDASDDHNTYTFQDQLQQLINLSHQLKRPALFISKEPGANNHFICGLFKDHRLLLINPLGITTHQSCYQILAELQEAGILQELWLSSDTLQQFAYESEQLVSCGPITLEFCLYLLAQTPEAWEHFWIQALMSGQRIRHGATGLTYYRMSLAAILPDTLRDLPLANEFNYRKSIIDLRNHHCEQLKRLPEQAVSSNHIDAIEAYLAQCKEAAPAQVVFNALITDHTMDTITALEAYQALEKELQIPAAQPNRGACVETANKPPMRTSSTQRSPDNRTDKAAPHVRYAIPPLNLKKMASHPKADADDQKTRLLEPTIWSDDKIPAYIQQFVASRHDQALTLEIIRQSQNYFEIQKKMGGKGKPRLPTISEADESGASFLDEFHRGTHLKTAGPLSRRVTEVVQAFEEESLDHEQPTSLGARLLDEDTLWEIRHYELFYLKYWCIKSAKSEDHQWSDTADEQDLKDFLEQLKDRSPTPTAFLNFFSDYKKLKEQLTAVYQEVQGYRLSPRITPRNGDHKAECKQLSESAQQYEQRLKAQEEAHKTEINKFEAIIKTKDDFINTQHEEIEKRKEEMTRQSETIGNQDNTIRQQDNIIKEQERIMGEQERIIGEQDKKNKIFETKFNLQARINTLLVKKISSGNLLDEEQEELMRLLQGASSGENFEPETKYRNF